MLIKVTQEHINKGRRQKCEACPVALAILDQCDEMGHVEATYSTAKLYRTEKNGSLRLPITISLPFEAKQFIHRFDSAQSVAPFEFELEI